MNPPEPPAPPPIRRVNDDSPSAFPSADYWRHRRAMAWLAVLAGLFFFPVGCVVEPGLLDLAPAFYSVDSAIVVAYMTTVVLDDKWKRGKP